MQALKVFAAVLALAAGAVSAQPPDGPHGRPGGPLDIDRLTVLLDLDAYQKTEVTKIFDARRQAHEAARANFKSSGERPSREVLGAQRQADEQATLTQLQAVLTEAQIAKFKLLTERPARRRGPPPADGESAPGPAVL